MARKLVVEIVGDASSLTRSYKQAENSTKAFGQSMERAGRGATTAAISVRGLGRAVGLTSASFIGGYGLVEGLRSVVVAGTEAAATQRQLAAQLQATGLSFQANRGQIEETATRLSSLSGFTRDDLVKSFTTLVRSTQAVKPALHDMSVAADIARGRNVSLASASIAIGKAAAGSTTSLKRLGIELPKGTTGLQAIAIAAERFRGQAEAGATSQQKFAATLKTTEEIVGTALLPTLNKYLGELTVWLDKMNRSGKLQRDTAAAVKVFTGAVDAVTPALKNMADGLKIASSHSSGLWKALKFMLGMPNVFQAGKIAVDDFNKALGRTKTTADAAFAALAGPVGTPTTAAGPPAGLAGLVGPVAAAPPKKGATVQQRNAWFDAIIGRDLDRVQDIPSLKGQIARLHEISGLVTARIAVTKDITRKLSLEDQVRQIARLARADQEQIDAKDAADAKAAAEKAKKIAEEIKTANQARFDALAKQIAAGQKYTASFQKLIATRHRQRRAQFQSQLFLSLGLTATGDDRAPSRGNLLADIRKAQQAIAGSPVDSKALDSKLTHLRQTLNTQFKSLTDDTKKRVAEWLDALAGKNPGGPLTPGHKSVPIADIIAGTGLRGAGLRQLEINLAGVGAKQIVVHTHVSLDGREIARNTTGHQERDRARRPTQTRGKVQP